MKKAKWKWTNAPRVMGLMGPTVEVVPACKSCKYWDEEDHLCRWRPSTYNTYAHEWCGQFSPHDEAIEEARKNEKTKATN